MQTLLNLWYPRNLSLYGCITILNSLALSKLVYNLSMLSFPHKCINTVDQVIRNFLRRKTAKIRHTTMIGPKEKGGLDMPDVGIINKSLQVMWIKRLNESTLAANWSHTPIEYLKPVIGCFFFYSDVTLT